MTETDTNVAPIVPTPRKTIRKRRDVPHVWESSAFTEAASEFLKGLWEDPTRLNMFRATMQAVWNDYKNTDRYETLRQRLSEAARNRD